MGKNNYPDWAQRGVRVQFNRDVYYGLGGAKTIPEGTVKTIKHRSRGVIVIHEGRRLRIQDLTCLTPLDDPTKMIHYYIVRPKKDNFHGNVESIKLLDQYRYSSTHKAWVVEARRSELEDIATIKGDFHHEDQLKHIPQSEFNQLVTRAGDFKP